MLRSVDLYKKRSGAGGGTLRRQERTPFSTKGRRGTYLSIVDADGLIAVPVENNIAVFVAFSKKIS